MSSRADPFLLPPSLSCPECQTGSSHQYEDAVGLTEWDHVECIACGEKFEIATAVDEALCDGPAMEHNLRLFGNLHGVHQLFQCELGDTALMEVRGIFESIYHVSYGFSGSILSDGISVRYLPTGYVLLALAPDPEGAQASRVDVMVSVIGRPKGATKVEPWRELFLEGCISARRSRRLPPILAVAGTDAFFAAQVEYDPDFQGRPSPWNSLAEEIVERDLVDMLDNPAYSCHLFEAVKVRNKLAHGGDPKVNLWRVSEELAEREGRWEEQHKAINREELQLAPSGEFVLRQTLGAIRAVRREGQIGTRRVELYGLVPERD